MLKPNLLNLALVDFLTAAVVELRRARVGMSSNPLGCLKLACVFQKVRDPGGTHGVRRNIFRNARRPSTSAHHLPGALPAERRLLQSARAIHRSEEGSGLEYMSDQELRRRTRRGLLKGEQIHALARDLNYGKRGRITKRDWLEQRNSASCLTLILASIIYWQAKEIGRVLSEHDAEQAELDLALLEHISPITWDNVILYGEYVLDRNLVKL